MYELIFLSVILIWSTHGLVDISPEEAATAFGNCFIEENLDVKEHYKHAVSASYSLFKSCPTQRFILAKNTKAMLRCLNFDPFFTTYKLPEKCPGNLVSISNEKPPFEQQYICFSNQTKLAGNSFVYILLLKVEYFLLFQHLQRARSVSNRTSAFNHA